MNGACVLLYRNCVATDRRPWTTQHFAGGEVDNAVQCRNEQYLRAVYSVIVWGQLTKVHPCGHIVHDDESDLSMKTKTSSEVTSYIDVDENDFGRRKCRR